SSTDLQPVLDAIARNAAQVCHAFDVRIRLLEGEQLRLVAHFGSLPVVQTVGSMNDEGTHRALSAEHRSVATADAQNRDDYPRIRDIARQNGMRSTLNTALLRAGEVIGLIGARRNEVRPFTDAE